MKASGLVKVVLVNLALIYLMYLVLQDYSWKESYASQVGFASATQYLPLVRIFYLGSGAASFRSPLTLDWVQVLLVAVFLVDIVYLLGLRPKETTKI